jgi:hypothetical protein
MQALFALLFPHYSPCTSSWRSCNSGVGEHVPANRLLTLHAVLLLCFTLSAGLAQLTRFEMLATRDEALAGLSAAPQLKCLQLNYHVASTEPSSANPTGCTAAGLMSLTALTELCQLELHLLSGDLNEDEWLELFSALQAVNEVSITAATVIEAATSAWRSLSSNNKPYAVMFKLS